VADDFGKSVVFEYYVTEKMAAYFYKKMPNESCEVINKKVTELLKFLMLANYHKIGAPFTSEIDEIWHLWILQTRQYQELMDKLPQKEFIHHSSNDYQKQPIIDSDYIKSHISYLASYVANFGDFTEDIINYYPFALYCMAVKNINLTELNEYLHHFQIVNSQLFN